MDKFSVTGMSCAACSAHVEKAVAKVPGVTSVTVSLLTNSMNVEGTAAPSDIIQAVTQAGYGASLQGGEQNTSAPAFDDPAAIHQLEVVGQQLDIPVFQMGQTDPVDIAKAAVAHAREHGNDLVFLDTAGRLHVDEELMDELRAIKAAVEPTEILLVVDAMIGP